MKLNETHEKSNVKIGNRGDWCKGGGGPWESAQRRRISRYCLRRLINALRYYGRSSSSLPENCASTLPEPEFLWRRRTDEGEGSGAGGRNRRGGYTWVTRDFLKSTRTKCERKQSGRHCRGKLPLQCSVVAFLLLVIVRSFRSIFRGACEETSGKGKGSRLFLEPFSIARREWNVIWWCWHSNATRVLSAMDAKGSFVRGEGSTKNRVSVPINHQTATLIMFHWWSL